MSDDKDDNNLKLIPNIELSELEKAIATIKADMPSMVEYQSINAKLLRIKYEALVKEGFTEIQALELSRTL